MEESILKKKSKDKRIKLGDSNTIYFSAVVKEKWQHNQVVELTTLHGPKQTDSKDIKEETIQFYQGFIAQVQHYYYIKTIWKMRLFWLCTTT